MNAGIENEVVHYKAFKDSISRGITNFVLKGKNGITSRYSNIIDVEHNNKSGMRKFGACNKGDIHLIDVHGNSYPISIKMSRGRTSWESADSSLKRVLHDFIDCYGRIKIYPNSILVYNEDIDLNKYVFGDDIIEKDGAIIISTASEKPFKAFNFNTEILYCNRVFTGINDIEQDEKFKPVIGVRSDPNRNKKDNKIRGYRIEVLPNYLVSDITSILDL